MYLICLEHGSLTLVQQYRAHFLMHIFFSTEDHQLSPKNLPEASSFLRNYFQVTHSFLEGEREDWKRNEGKEGSGGKEDNLSQGG